MKKYIKPTININLFEEETVLTTASGVLQSWRTEGKSRRTVTVDWSLSEILNTDF